MGGSVQHRIITLAVVAVIDGDKVTLLDRKGRVLRDGIALSEVQVADRGAVECYLWRRWAAAADRGNSRNREEKLADPWTRKAVTLSASFRLRRHAPPPQSNRRRFQEYPTKTWPEAATRMWMQGHNRWRRHDRSGWVSWSHSVSSNQNKRAEARYGEENEHYCRASA